MKPVIQWCFYDTFIVISFIMFSNLIAVTYSPNILFIHENTVSVIHLCPYLTLSFHCWKVFFFCIFTVLFLIWWLVFLHLEFFLTFIAGLNPLKIIVGNYCYCHKNHPWLQYRLLYSALLLYHLSVVVVLFHKVLVQ